MPPSKVIRIDEEVWAELQKRARPLEDTPDSVLRRVFGLPDEGSEADGMDSHITTLLELAEESLGEVPQVHGEAKNYSLLSKAGEVVGYIRPQRERLMIGVSKELAQSVGLGGWHRERRDSFLGGDSVRWYVPEGDKATYHQAAGLLVRLWRSDSKH